MIGRRTPHSPTRIRHVTGWAVCGLLAVTAAAPLRLQAQADNGASSAPLVTPAVPTNNINPDLAQPAVPDTYFIGRDDLLQIYVFQMPELTRQVRVDDRGGIRLPLLPQEVPAAGLTSTALAASVAGRLVAAGYARRPYVQVTVLQVMSHRIVVAGAVKNPQVLQAMRPMSLLEVLSRAGGLDLEAGATVTVTTMGSAGPMTQSYSLGDLLQGTRPGAEVMLDGGETVRVIPAQMIYAVGALGKPGAFPLQVGEPLTILKTLALAQGIKDPADQSHAEIIRTSAAGTRTPIPINLKKVLKHEQPDVQLQAGDIFYVPESARGKNLQTIVADAGQMAVIALGYNATKIF